MKLDAKAFWFPTAVLFVICVVVSAALAGTNLLTKDKIAEQQALKGGRIPQNRAGFCRLLRARSTANTMPASKTARLWGVFETESKGYGGTVRVMTGISSEEKLPALSFSAQRNPGPGRQCGEEDFRNQYKQAAPESGIEIVNIRLRRGPDRGDDRRYHHHESGDPGGQSSC